MGLGRRTNRTAAVCSSLEACRPELGYEGGCGLGKGAHLLTNPAMVGSRQLLMYELAHRTPMRITVLVRAVLGLGKGTHLRANPAMVGSHQLFMYELAHRTRGGRQL